MVAVIPAAAATAATSNPRVPKNPSPSPRRRAGDLRSPTRPPLRPSEKDNAATANRRPRAKEITSRYLSSSAASSSSKPTSSSASKSTSTTSSASARRFPSPLPNPRPSISSALPQNPTPKRSQSVDRTRPAPAPAPPPRTTRKASEVSNAARTLCTTTRSLSVSFQGESFSYQTSKAKPTSPSPSRRPTPDRPRLSASATPSRSDHQLETSRPLNHGRRWPAARTQMPNSLTRSVDCSLGQKDPILEAVRLLRQSMVFDEGARRASFDGGEFSASSDTDSISSGSNSGSQEHGIPSRLRSTPRGISIPARYWQESSNRSRRLPEPGSPKPMMAKKSLANGPFSSPSSVPSAPHGNVRPSSPSKIAASPSRATASPSRMRNGTVSSSSPVGQLGNAPSILNFATEVRRGKKGEGKIEEAHVLRLLHNRHLQWRCANARANTALLAQRQMVENDLYNAWITSSEMRDSITIKRLKLQVLTQSLKITSILKGQMSYLEEWSLMDNDHSSSLSGAIEALKASTLRLPVVGGAKADIQEVKNAVGSAVDVMQAMGSSICSMLSQLEGTSSVVSELAKLVAQELSLVGQSRELLSRVAAMHVRQCSLLGHITQLSRKPSLMQV